MGNKTATKVTLNPQTQAWLDWIDSRVGHGCMEDSILKSNGAKYLRNRLWYAFMAGYEAACAQCSRSDAQDTATPQPGGEQK